VEGALLLAAARWQGRSSVRPRLTDAIYSYGCESSTWIPGHGPKLKAVVFDASDLQHTDQLKQLREFFQPLLKNLEQRAPGDPRPRPGKPRRPVRRQRPTRPRGLQPLAGQGAAQRRPACCMSAKAPKTSWKARCGFPLAEKRLHLGQVIRLDACATPVEDWTRPLAGRKALVTGAARASARPSPKPWPATAPR
jgi:3-oxoacyl-[acyl-carrier protein] reductase